MENLKKVWKRPELTVLVRNEPEEMVLTACKRAGGPGPNEGNQGKCNQGPNTAQVHCFELSTS